MANLHEQVQDGQGEPLEPTEVDPPEAQNNDSLLSVPQRAMDTGDCSANPPVPTFQHVVTQFEAWRPGITDYEFQLMRSIRDNDYRRFMYLINEMPVVFRNLIMIGESPIMKAINNCPSPVYLKATYINLNHEDRFRFLFDVPLDQFGNNFIQFCIKMQNTSTWNQILAFREHRLIENKTSNGENILHLAAKYCPYIACAILNDGHFKINILRELLNEFNHNMEQPLHVAVKHQRDLELVRQLVIKGANLESRTIDNFVHLTPLLLAARDQNMEMVLQLVQLGANLSVMNVRGLFTYIKNNCPLHILKGLFKQGLVVPADILNQHISPEEMKQILDDCYEYDENTQMIKFTCSAFPTNSFADIKNFVSVAMAPLMQHLFVHPVIQLFITLQYQLTKETYTFTEDPALDMLGQAQIISSFHRPQVFRINEAYVSALTGQIATAPATLMRAKFCTYEEVETLKNTFRVRGQLCSTKFVSFAIQ